MGSNHPANTRQVRISLTDAQDSRLNQVARRYGVTKSAIIRVALEREFALEEQLSGELPTSRPTKKKNRGTLQPLLF
jgi:hypothetical protein